LIPTWCRRLIEVDFPIAEVSAQSAREKAIRHGHPSTLHLWWARRPLASCRAVLLGLLLPDPKDKSCPDSFKKKARQILSEFMLGANESDDDLRKAMISFIASFSNWDNSSRREYIAASRALLKAFFGEEAPVLLDPFAGGGSIPLEGLRIGCEVFASDLNPVSALILKVMLEDVPHVGSGLGREFRNAGKRINSICEAQLSSFYPSDQNGTAPIAYLWARTISCEAPNCGAEIPLAKSFWLSKKRKLKRALRYRVKRVPGRLPEVEFEIFEPKTKGDIPVGTVSGAKATCPCCNTSITPARVRAQLSSHHYGTDTMFDKKGNRIGGARLLAIVTQNSANKQRGFRLPTKRDYDVVARAHSQLEKLVAMGTFDGMSQIPDEPLPSKNPIGIRLVNYGVKTWGDVFAIRQKLTLLTLTRAVRELPEESERKAVIKELLALAVSRTADYCSANCTLHVGAVKVAHTWSRNALPAVWDYYETVPFGEGSGNFEGAIDWIARVVENLEALSLPIGQVQATDACDLPLPDDSADIWFTDPPYYNAIGYADASDFFFVWLKRLLPGNRLLKDPYDANNKLTPKTQEIIQDDSFEEIRGLRKDEAFFEWKIGRAFSEGHRILRGDGIGCTVFAHKTTEGWEALLSGMLNAGWVITDPMT
jgi:putative DNA methylase